MIPHLKSGVLDIHSARQIISWDKEKQVSRWLVDASTRAMSNCTSALYKSLDYDAQITLLTSPSTAEPGEWQTLRDIPDFDIFESWSLRVTSACAAYILLAGLVAAKDTFATFIHFEWSLMPPLSIVYWIYWVLAGIISLFICIFFAKECKPPFDLEDMLFLWFLLSFVFYIPFAIFGYIEYVVARLVCHRPINFIEAIIAIIVLLLPSTAFVPAIYFAFIGTNDVLELFNVYDRVIAWAITLGVFALGIACSQWTLYKDVRSTNFFRQFAIARQQRGRISIYPQVVQLFR
jgi:hypothetical protein